MRKMILSAAAPAVLVSATLVSAAPATALTSQVLPSPASMEAARHFAGQPHLIGDIQSSMIGSGLRADGRMDFSGDTATSVGYRSSAEPAGPPKAERYFEDEPITYRIPGVTVLRRAAATTPVDGK